MTNISPFICLTVRPVRSLGPLKVVADMAYIDATYYQDVFKGADAGEELERYIERASDLVDQITNYKIRGFEALPPFIQEQVKKATAAQGDVYVLQGGPDGGCGTTDGRLAQGSVAASRYYAERIHEPMAGGKRGRRVAPATFGYLGPTGLVYRGVGIY